MVAKLDLPNERGRVRTDRTFRVEGRDDVWALGDAALIPLVDAPSARNHYAPPTAQFAVREARRLAGNVAAALDGRPPRAVRLQVEGRARLARRRRAVSPRCSAYRLSGFPAWLLWRGYYLSFVPGFATKVRIPCSGCSTSIVGRSTVQTGVRRGPGTRYIRYRAGDRVFEEGNRADGFYAVVEGAFELTVRDPDGSRDGPAHRPRRPFRRARAARRGPAHRHGARARGFAGAGDRRRGLPAAERGRCPRLRDYFDRYVSEAFQPAMDMQDRRSRSTADRLWHPGTESTAPAGRRQMSARWRLVR